MKKELTPETVLELGRARTAQVFDRFDVPAVSFSGGKDSTVVLNLALDEMRLRKADGRLPKDWKLIVVFWDEEAIHPETIDYCDRVRQMDDVDFRWLCLPIKHVNACSKDSPYWFCWAPEKRDKWCRPLPPWGITDLPNFQRKSHAECLDIVFPKEDGKTIGLILGIRADESLRRYRSVTHRTEDNWLSAVGYAKHIMQCKTIYDWNTLDVWTAPFLLDWDWNRAYDVMGRAGLSPSSQRVCHPFGQQPLQNLWMWRLCWPELWEKLCERVPGANTAMMYAKSPLYASSGKAKKREDETWEEGITRELVKWDSKVRREIAVRIQREIERHNRIHPGVKVPATVYHVDCVKGITSGLTYDFLLKVAIKGDIKGRMNPPRPTAEELAEFRAAKWGENWADRYPDIAARTVWHSKENEWVTPVVARERGLR